MMLFSKLKLEMLRKSPRASYPMLRRTREFRFGYGTEMGSTGLSYWGCLDSAKIMEICLFGGVNVRSILRKNLDVGCLCYAVAAGKARRYCLGLEVSAHKPLARWDFGCLNCFLSFCMLVFSLDNWSFFLVFHTFLCRASFSILPVKLFSHFSKV